MKKIRKCQKFPDLDFQFHPEYIPEHALFLDIETTGFSPASAKIYLIGTAYLEGTELVTEQFFAESPEEEGLILAEFLSMLQHVHTLISFNGLGFDIPFLKKRWKHLRTGQTDRTKISDDVRINGDLQINDLQITHTDLHKISFSYRHVLQLENYKLKTLEKFLGIMRKDLYDGGELISVYHKYRNQPDETLLQLLLKHNQEDLLALAGLLPLCTLDDFFAGNFQITGCSEADHHKIDGTRGRELVIRCQPARPLPAAFSCGNGCYYLHGTPQEAVLCIPVAEGTLKYFYPNWKDYYYLPEEDMAIHKSVAAYVEKSHRQKASAASCYTNKTGAFLPQYEEIFTPAFYKTYKAAISYFELSENLKQDKDMLKKYSMHILDILNSGS